MEYLAIVDFSSKWHIAFYGWFLFNLFSWYVEKQKADKKKEDFGYWIYTKTHVDDWIVSLAFTVPIVYNGLDIHNFIWDIVEKYTGWRIQWYDVFYAFPGVLMQFLYFFVTEVWPKAKLNILKRIGVQSSTPPPPPDQN